MIVWQQLHWRTRLTMLAVVLAILLWQMRFAGTFARAMYGWPMAFNYIRIPGASQWNPLTLLGNVAIWVGLAGGVGYTIERFRGARKGWQDRAVTVLEMMVALAVTAAVAYSEWCVRYHAGNATPSSRHAIFEWHGGRLAVDIGLFTESIHHWPLTRAVLVFAIICTAYTIIDLVRVVASCCSVLAGVRETTTHSIHITHDEHSHRVTKEATGAPEHATNDPMPARVLMWILFGIVAWLVLTLTPPR